MPGERRLNLVGEGGEHSIDARVGMPKHLDPLQSMTDVRVVPSIRRCFLNPKSCNVSSIASVNERRFGTKSRHPPENNVHDIGYSVQGEEPHEEEVVTPALRKLEL